MLFTLRIKKDFFQRSIQREKGSIPSSYPFRARGAQGERKGGAREAQRIRKGYARVFSFQATIDVNHYNNNEKRDKLLTQKTFKITGQSLLSITFLNLTKQSFI